MNRHPAPRFLALAAVAILAAACSGAAATTSEPAPTAPTGPAITLALVHGNVIDGTGAPAIADATLLIAGDRIAKIGPFASTPAPQGVKTIDLAGATVLPGFIDAHVHYAFDRANLRAWAEGGVTTVRDEGAFELEEIRNLKAYKAEIAKDPHLARLVSMGQGLKVPDGYGQREVTSAENGREVVREEIANGVDGVKVTNENGTAGQTDLPRMTPEEWKAIVDEAHAHGVPVSGHITSGPYMMALLEAGVDDIAHAPIDVLPPEAVKYMVDHDVYIEPTFSVFKNYGVPMYALEANVGQLAKAGVHIALGDDFRGGPGDWVAGIPMVEIEEMSASGMTPMQIIQSATLNGSKLLRLDKEIGTLEAGKLADILVVGADPLADLQALRNVRLVVHGGAIIRDEISAK